MTPPADLPDPDPTSVECPTAAAEAARPDQSSSDGLPNTLPLDQVPAVGQKEPPSTAAQLIIAAATPGRSADDTDHVRRRAAPPNTPARSATGQPRLRVMRGLRLHAEYPVYEGQNFIGRRDDEPVDIDLGDQEPADCVWSSRRHALLTLTGGLLRIQDLHSRNGTFVNRHRVYPGQTRTLMADDVIQVGTVQLKVLL
jgi:FHA domain